MENKKINQGKTKTNSRKKFIFLSSVVLAGFAFFKSKFVKNSSQVISCSPNNSQPAKFLTEDGRLVEVNINKLHKETKPQKHLSNKELMEWVKKS